MWFINIMKIRCFQSLISNPVEEGVVIFRQNLCNDHRDTVCKRKKFINSLQPREPVTQELKVDFTLDSLHAFCGQHRLHKELGTLGVPDSTLLRKRPNYDNRRRQFFANANGQKVVASMHWFKSLSAFCPKFVSFIVFSHAIGGAIKAGGKWQMSREIGGSYG